jgi:uncharacterized protein YtpQ (UPF0354 family)
MFIYSYHGLSTRTYYSAEIGKDFPLQDDNQLYLNDYHVSKIIAAFGIQNE